MSWCSDRGRLRGIVAVVAGAVLAVVPGTPAGAHPVLVRSDPADGQTVADAPDRLRLEFSEPLSRATVRLELRPTDGTPRTLTVDAGAASSTAITAALPDLDADVYEVWWTGTSAEDGHRVVGNLVFGVRRAVAAHAPAVRAGPEPGDAIIATGRLLGESGAVGGLVVAALLVAGRRRHGPPWDRVRRRGLLVALAGAAVAASAVAAAALTGRIWLALDTAHARRLIEEFILLVGLGLGVGLAHRRARAGPIDATCLALAVLSTVVAAVDGHAAVSAGPDLLLAAAAHGVAAAVWTGGVAALVVAGWPLTLDAGPRLRALVLAFGPYAVGALVIVGISGPLLAGRQVSTVQAGLSTPYGAVLAAKLGLAAVALLLAVRVARQRLTRDGLVMVALLLGGTGTLAAVLTATPPARGPGVDLVASTIATQRTLRAGDLVLMVAVRPGTPGRNVVSVDVFDTRRPAPGPVTGVALTVAGAPLAALPAAAVGQTVAGRWQATATLPQLDRVPIGVSVRRDGLPTSTVGLDWATRSALDTPSGWPVAPLARAAAWLVAAVAAVLAVALAVRRRGRVERTTRRPASGSPP